MIVPLVWTMKKGMVIKNPKMIPTTISFRERKRKEVSNPTGTLALKAIKGRKMAAKQSASPIFAIPGANFDPKKGAKIREGASLIKIKKKREMTPISEMFGN